uniref:Uncharacterized protein n=1 Tax=Branchiostoma floridae TaxID=7739 RepID=C3ZVD3_BRAFL|eukprot:XP_002587443.1 hypothetical protein BRAFLDRAFT_100125 [Branchiostoma floridae]
MEKYWTIVTVLCVAAFAALGTEMNPCRPPSDVKVCGCSEGLSSSNPNNTCTVCACSSDGNTMARDCFGAVDTVWEPLYEPAGYRHWVILDLQQAWRIFRLGIANYGDVTHDVMSFVLERQEQNVTKCTLNVMGFLHNSSPSGSVWEFVNSSDAVQAGITILQTFDVYSHAQYLKLTVETHSGEGPRIREIALYGTGTSYPQYLKLSVDTHSGEGPRIREISLYGTDKPPLFEPCVVIHAGCTLDETAERTTPPGDQHCYVITDIHERIHNMSSAVPVHRTGNITFHSEFSVECLEDYEISLYWTVRGVGPTTSGHPLDDVTPEGVPQNNLYFSFPPRTLPLGVYMVQFQATLTVPGSDHVSISAVQTWVKVERMPLTYTIGPIVQTINTTRDLVIDAARSFDPEGLLNSKGFLFDLDCTYKLTQPVDFSNINIAVCKKATSSGNLHGGVPERAIDGNHGEGQWDSLSCVHSAEEPNPWWMVDLGSEYSIASCIENCNQASTIAAWPLVLAPTSEIQGTIEYTLEEYPIGHAAENWTSVIQVSSPALQVPGGVFVDVGNYTIRLTDTVGSWQKISEWRFEVLPNPVPSVAAEGSNETVGGDPQSLSEMCTLLPPAGTSLMDQFCITCQEFVDVLGPLETQVSFKLNPIGEFATVTFPGDGPPTENEIGLLPFNGWIKALTRTQLNGYLDGFMNYPTGTFFRLIHQGEAQTAFLGSVIVSYTAGSMAAAGEDITELMNARTPALTTDFVKDEPASVDEAGKETTVLASPVKTGMTVESLAPA